MSNNQKGLGHVMVFMAVIVIAIVGFAGYTVMKKNSDTTTKEATTSTVPTAAKVEEVNSDNDLDKAAQVLESTDTADQASDQGDISKLEAAIN